MRTNRPHAGACDHVENRATCGEERLPDGRMEMERPVSARIAFKCGDRPEERVPNDDRSRDDGTSRKGTIREHDACEAPAGASHHGLCDGPTTRTAGKNVGEHPADEAKHGTAARACLEGVKDDPNRDEGWRRTA